MALKCATNLIKAIHGKIQYDWWCLEEQKNMLIKP